MGYSTVLRGYGTGHVVEGTAHGGTHSTREDTQHTSGHSKRGHPVEKDEPHSTHWVNIHHMRASTRGGHSYIAHGWTHCGYT